jgi:hypothetical protein
MDKAKNRFTGIDAEACEQSSKSDIRDGCQLFLNEVFEDFSAQIHNGEH